jgi:hypothetical protein
MTSVSNGPDSQWSRADVTAHLCQAHDDESKSRSHNRKLWTAVRGGRHILGESQNRQPAEEYAAVDETTPLRIAESTLGAQDLLTDILRNGARHRRGDGIRD